MGTKVAVVGGGSTYTPELVEGFVHHRDRLAVDELVLHDVDPERLEVVGGLARRMLAANGMATDLVLSSDRPRALDGAGFVLVQLRVGGQAARLSDETLPLEFGCIGQETTGPGGFAKALRTVPVVLDIAEETAARAAQGAWLIDFTNPVGIVTQALSDAGHRAIGLCNVAITLQRRLASRLGVEPSRLELEHVGLNHLSWVRAVRVDGQDHLPEVLDQHGQAVADEVGLPVGVLRLLRAIPSYYLRYYYLTEEVLEEQRSGAHPSRASEVMDIERELLDSYRDPSLAEKPVLLERRGGAFYSEAAVQLMASLRDGAGDVQVVDARNEGAIPDLPRDAVVEVGARIEAGGPRPVSVEPLDPAILGLVQQVKAYERLAVGAALSGSRSLALQALLANPLVPGYPVAERLLEAILEANRAHLPRFFPRG